MSTRQNQHFKCIYCDQSLEAPDKMAGVEVDCPACNKKIIIPVLKEEIANVAVNEPSAGYIYALSNVYMPGVLKIGMTHGDVEKEVQDLSSVKGVPATFTVAFQQYVDNSVSAEAYIYQILEDHGCRVETNREFFKATPSDVISALNSYLSMNTVKSIAVADDNGWEKAKLASTKARESGIGVRKAMELLIAVGETGNGDAYHEMCCLFEACVTMGDMSPDEFPVGFGDSDEWHRKAVELGSIDGIIYEAGLALNGTQTQLKNIDRAIQLFEQAASLGSGYACCYLADLYWNGENLNRNIKKAIYWAKKGIDINYFESFIFLAKIYEEQGEPDDADVCWQWLFHHPEFPKEEFPPVDEYILMMGHLQRPLRHWEYLLSMPDDTKLRLISQLKTSINSRDVLGSLGIEVWYITKCEKLVEELTSSLGAIATGRLTELQEEIDDRNEFNMELRDMLSTPPESTDDEWWED